MRSRNTENMVVTTETLMQDKANIAEDSYEKVRLPKVRATTIVKKTSPGPQKPGADGASVAARCTEVVFQKIPRTVDWKECLINIQAATISPLDLFIAKHGTETLFRDDLQLQPPHALGCSGVGVVEVVGPGVRDVEDGDWVVPLRDGLGTFTSLSIWDDKDFMKVPKEIMPVEYMALHRELCVGYYLMETVAADLKAGDALVVNAANGAVGQVVIQLCRLMNIRAIAITRRHDNFSDTKAWLEFLGAYKVFADDEPIVPALQREYASLPKLAFDGVAIAGFSHGGVVAMYTALTKLSQPLGCCVAVGGPPVLPQLLGRKIKPHLRDTPVHCLGGAADATFPASDCKHVVDSVLSAALPAANFKEIPYGQHEVGGLEIGALADVFADNVKL
ncbi:hypothetical protein AURANDRAFT_65428 [Aureococcus anophagefferens]|uniref:Enoyl reductase (ER) domain-containing protein n=1 Tax=Aureococcus anophagefferens TaxID=44056 RepID=F0YDK5_AURAN|nr:hypothetical protein AURANDRAFT_65428 [Aureococcus anophagefferens]EGB06751.1 hypothetical protein AURANDRAFT_65428 [Aureococcus anophagefferens]|eukprot:XP_009038500.1 hypothetical protein AURANDRAFT_65428 [Aureococcus anophagefferens]